MKKSESHTASSQKIQVISYEFLLVYTSVKYFWRPRSLVLMSFRVKLIHSVYSWIVCFWLCIWEIKSASSQLHTNCHFALAKMLFLSLANTYRIECLFTVSILCLAIFISWHNRKRKEIANSNRDIEKDGNRNLQLNFLHIIIYEANKGCY